MTLEDAVRDWPTYLEIKGSALQGMGKRAREYGLKDVASLNPARFDASFSMKPVVAFGDVAGWPEEVPHISIRHVFFADGKEFHTLHSKALRDSDVVFFVQRGLLPADAKGLPI